MDGPWLTSWVMMGHDSYGIKWLVYPTNHNRLVWVDSQ